MTDERKDLPPVNSPNFLEKVREALSVYLGNRGSGLDRGVTLRDLSEAGLVELRKGFGSGNTRNPIGGAGSLITSGAWEIYESDLTPPPTPTGFTATAGITNLLLECDPQTYIQGHGHAKSKLYGATWTAGPLPVFSDAVVITEFSGPVASHATNPATTWHLWLKWVTVDGVESTIPAGGTNGVVTRTGENVALLLEALTGEITESQLYVDLGSRIDLIDTPTTGLVDQVGAVKTVVNNPATGVLATAASLDAVKNTVNNATTGVTATATRVSALETTVNTGPDRNTALRASVTNEATTRADADTALATRATNLESSVNNATTGLATKASVSQVATAKSEAIAASASVTDTISARLNTGDFAAVQVQSSASASAVTGLLAQYTVKLDVGGKVSGYGLASSSTSSEFAIRADRFYIAPPETGGGTATQIIPFAVQATATTINGVAVPAGVYINDAYIKNGTITTAKIGNAQIDNAKIASVSATKITAGAIGVGSFISSTNYTPGSLGWTINANGTAEFGAASIRGQLTAAQIDTRGLSIKDALGNVIFASGTALSTSYITGLGALATLGSLSYSEITGTKPPSNADKTESNTAAAIVNQGAFATLDKITSTNVSTYISNLAVNTLHIAGRAVIESTASAVPGTIWNNNTSAILNTTYPSQYTYITQVTCSAPVNAAGVNNSYLISVNSGVSSATLSDNGATVPVIMVTRIIKNTSGVVLNSEEIALLLTHPSESISVAGVFSVANSSQDRNVTFTVYLGFFKQSIAGSTAIGAWPGYFANPNIVVTAIKNSITSASTTRPINQSSISTGFWF